MKIALTYNLKQKDETKPLDYFSEFDSQETINAISAALKSKGHSVDLVEVGQHNLFSYFKNNNVDIVFFSPKENAEKYMDFFLQTSPFDKNKGRLNFYYIDSYKPACELYKGIAILCYSKELIKKASSCPNDIIVVLDTQRSEIRSSSYMNVLSINTNHELSVLSHEFGHSFANLAEEYVPAKLPRGIKNCVGGCENFDGEKDGCFEGCSDANYFRSVDAGVMRTLNSNNYGIFNEGLILKRLEIIQNQKITGRAISEISCTNQNYYLIEASYNEDKIELIDKTIEKGCIGKSGAGPFSYEIQKTDSSTINGYEFNPEFIFTDAQGETQIDGSVEKYGGNFLLKIPIIKDSEALKIYRENNLISEINLRDTGARACLT